jgi:hypothetical protein
MKKILVLITAIIISASFLYAEEKTAEARKPVGISFGLTYHSNYLWRGTSWFDGDGVFTPFISYDIAGSGLVFMILGELSASSVSTQQAGRNSQNNQFSFSRQGINFSLDYSIALGKIAAIKLNSNTAVYPISKDYDINNINLGNGSQPITINQSGLTITAGIYFDGIPLKPYLSYTHDFNFGNPYFRYTDFYIKFGIAQDFELAKNLTFTPGAYLGLFNNPSFNYTRAENYAGSQFGISEVAVNAVLAYKIGGATISAMFTYIYFPFPEKFELPATDYKNRFFATVAVSYTF